MVDREVEGMRKCKQYTDIEIEERRECKRKGKKAKKGKRRRRRCRFLAHSSSFFVLSSLQLLISPLFFFLFLTHLNGHFLLNLRNRREQRCCPP